MIKGAHLLEETDSVNNGHAVFADGGRVPACAPEEITDDPEEYQRRLELLSDDEKAEAHYLRGVRDTAEIGVDHIKNVHRALLSFQGDKDFALKASAAAHGFWTLLTERDQQDIADHYGFTKANVNKLVKQIQRELGLPPMAGQRSKDGCRNMGNARKRQLKSK